MKSTNIHYDHPHHDGRDLLNSEKGRDRPVIFMFSGQGSQYYQMGQELFRQHPIFRNWMFVMDNRVVELTGRSILKSLYPASKRTDHHFNITRLTHPAIFMVEYALARVLMDRGMIPDLVLGASLGEFTAAAVAGVMDVGQALEAVVKQAEIFESSCAGGGMLAILDRIDVYHRRPMIFEGCALAAVNSPSHFVVAGPVARLQLIEAYLNKRQMPYSRLPVSHAFHSALIDAAEARYKANLESISFQSPRFPVISCAMADEVQYPNKEFFWRTVRNTIRFQETISRLEKKKNHIFLDLGPSGTLGSFVKANLPEGSTSKNFALLTPFGRDLKSLERVSQFVLKLQKNKRTVEDHKMMTYVFPGQGAQVPGMGKSVFSAYPEYVAKTDTLLGYSIEELCLEDPQQKLNQTKYTQPALYVVNALTYFDKMKQWSSPPDFFMGHSLGEYNALLAAGVFDFETGLKLVQKRGDLMSLAPEGAMAAVIGLSVKATTEILQQNNLDSIDIANYNSPSQIVISGPVKDVAAAKPIFESNGAKLFITLKVSGAFHSRYMRSARDAFEHYLDQFEFSAPTIPVISNVLARPYPQDRIKALLASQLTAPVKWSESVQYVMGSGEMDFEEIGQGQVLSGLIKQIRKETETNVVKMTDVDETPDRSKKTAPLWVDSDRIPAMEKGLNTNAGSSKITATDLGSKSFREDYNVKYAYAAGSIPAAISSKELVTKMGQSGLLSFFGTSGLEIDRIEEAIRYFKQALQNDEPYGMGLQPGVMEEDMVQLFMKHGVRNVEVSRYVSITPALVRFRLNGVRRKTDGSLSIANRIVAKISRPEVAEAFLRPAPERLVKKLRHADKITPAQAELATLVPLADDLCVEANAANNGNHNDLFAYIPAMIELRNAMMKQYQYKKIVRVGAAGGIGTPEAAAAAFILGAEFIFTGSINQCTVEAGTSDIVKTMLQSINVQDTALAPSPEPFESGEKMQVLRRGVFFPNRANKLFDLYQRHKSLEEMDAETLRKLQDNYFKCSFEDLFDEIETNLSKHDPKALAKANENPKQKMALIFKSYLTKAFQMALEGREDQKVNFLVPCTPALGAFNQWVKETPLETWHSRYVDQIAEKLMHATADCLSLRFDALRSS